MARWSAGRHSTRCRSPRSSTSKELVWAADSRGFMPMEQLFSSALIRVHRRPNAFPHLSGLDIKSVVYEVRRRLQSGRLELPNLVRAIVRTRLPILLL